jgi:hypothetical protein
LILSILFLFTIPHTFLILHIITRLPRIERDYLRDYWMHHQIRHIPYFRKFSTPLHQHHSSLVLFAILAWPNSCLTDKFLQYHL